MGPRFDGSRFAKALATTSLAPAALLLAAAPADARLQRIDHPGCDLAGEHALTGGTGDVAHAHISMRADVLAADTSSARWARRLTQAQADALTRRIDRIRRDADRLTAKQGFLSAAERATYDRQLDAAAAPLCRP